jgi:hypothetical protein
MQVLQILSSVREIKPAKDVNVTCERYPKSPQEFLSITSKASGAVAFLDGGHHPELRYTPHHTSQQQFPVAG